jgi:hypothetical protein
MPDDHTSLNGDIISSEKNPCSAYFSFGGTCSSDAPLARRVLGKGGLSNQQHNRTCVLLQLQLLLFLLLLFYSGVRVVTYPQRDMAPRRGMCGC